MSGDKQENAQITHKDDAYRSPWSEGRQVYCRHIHQSMAHEQGHGMLAHKGDGTDGLLHHPGNKSAKMIEGYYAAIGKHGPQQEMTTKQYVAVVPHDGATEH